jgi:hypothetical protein
MYGLSRERAGALVAAAGGRLIAVVEDACAGEDWVSHRYFAARA